MTKKIILLFSGAIASFLLLSYIDEYENLVLPLLPATKVESPLAGKSEEVLRSDLQRTIRAFNDILSRTYLESDPSLLKDGPLDQRLIPFIAKEIAYLTKEGKVMLLDVSEVTIDKVEGLSPVAVQVKTREIVGMSYLSYPGKEKKSEYPLTIHKMRYTLNWTMGRWIVLSFETVSVSELDSRQG